VTEVLELIPAQVFVRLDMRQKYTAVCLYASTGKRTGQRDGELGPDDVLARRVGDVVADASPLFDASFKRKDLNECGCNMHYCIRRRVLSGAERRAPAPCEPDTPSWGVGFTQVGASARWVI
jgi:hypothetical protein